MQKMSEKEATEMLKAKLTCMKLEALSCIEKGCDKDCDNCQYNYAQGTVGEQKAALEAAIKALEELSQYKQGGLVLIPADVYKRQCDELDEYKAIGTVEELKELKYNGAFSGIELANIAASLAELQKYQAIGTVEECREAVERMKPKKVKKIQIPNTSWSKACTRFECPSCNKYLNYMELSHCGLCGQCLDWRNDMKRLTKRSENGTGVYATPSGDPIKWDDNRHKVLQKLADYEDLEDQGRLLILPCAVGDVLYDISEYVEGFSSPLIYKIHVRSIEILKDEKGIIYCIDSSDYRETDFGKIVFHTIEEAEAALEKMKGEEHEK